MQGAVSCDASLRSKLVHLVSLPCVQLNEMHDVSSACSGALERYQLQLCHLKNLLNSSGAGVD